MLDKYNFEDLNFIGFNTQYFKTYYAQNLDFKQQINAHLLTCFPIKLPPHISFETAINLDVFGMLHTVQDKLTGINPLTYFKDTVVCLMIKREVMAYGVIRHYINVKSKMLLYLHSICVPEKHRRRGLCDLLIRHIKKKCPDAYITLDVKTEKKNSNIPAIKCYVKNGFSFSSLHYNIHSEKHSMMIYNPSKKKTNDVLTDKFIYMVIHKDPPFNLELLE